ncbi:MAG TPA: PQQ-binding-like beta-propeller repeat protein [Bacteroidales bacterium]|nr:PQQ-binding-like beta-propeller repeat protein [Bacteroidales bacterium]HQI69855.1 PQQ-binding-like beta-propeller repeat protein [Bacteroidales bacterium]
MKKLLFVLILFCFDMALYAQCTYTFSIKDTKGQPVKDVLVTAQNSEKNIVLKSKTNDTGTATFTLTEGGTYAFSYLEIKDAATLDLPEGFKGKGGKTVTYDPEKIFAEKTKYDRTGITFTTRLPQQLKGQPNVVKFMIDLRKNNETAIPNTPLEIVDCNDKVKYKGTTDANGIATFYLPGNKDFEVDVEGNQAVHTFKVPNKANAEFKNVVYYERTQVKESSKGDTIFQTNITQTKGTSTHMLFTISLVGFDDQPLPNEKVFLDAENSKKVYAGTTDKNGACRFMLEKGANYLVNLKYESGIHLVEVPSSLGFASASITRRYRGSAAIEQMMAERHINEKGFVVNHEQTPVRAARKPSNYLKITDQGFDIDFATSGPIGTSTIIGNNLYTQEGFYSPNFYCLQALTGAYQWGIELGESGASPIVYHEGVLLVNTYSCTLYAFDASTGKMLWSKWLAGTIYSTPSADSNSVYVVYNNGYSNPANPSESFVVTSFDLRSGKMNWINWIDKEVIACPVVEGKEVHVASQSGNYYVFDKISGKQSLFSNNIKAVSSPTLTPQNIYVTASVNSREQLVVLDRKTLQIKKKYPTHLATKKINNRRSCYEQMNYNGAHPVVYKNHIVIITDSVSVTAFDANSEKILWQHSVSTHPNQIPLVANEKVVLATAQGEIKTFDLATGVLVKTQKLKGNIDGQLLTNKGYMYVGAEGALSAVKVTPDVQWNQWNKDARHNIYYK